MADAKDADAELPSYQDSNEAAAVNEVLGPATLYIAGRFIHCSDPNAPPLYELSHSIGFLADTDRTVRFERLHHSVRHNDGTPQVTSRKRHIFDLKHPTPAEFPKFEFHAESLSRRNTLCSFGISEFPLHKLRSGKGFRIHRALKGSDGKFAPRDVLFTAVPSRDKTVGYEWSDAQGKLVAREVETEDLMTFVIGAEMGVLERDALVASWVVRIWWELARGNYRDRKWEEGEFPKEMGGQPSLRLTVTSSEEDIAYEQSTSGRYKRSESSRREPRGSMTGEYENLLTISSVPTESNIHEPFRTLKS